MLINAHRIPTKQANDQPKRPNPIIVRFIHFSDKRFVMSKGANLFGKKMRIVDDLPPNMKEARHELAKIAYKIRQEEKLQTRIKVTGTHILLETRTSSKDKWFLRKDFHCL